jgi:dihydroorotate dehydrogenase (NAD+) catalytic subunit
VSLDLTNPVLVASGCGGTGRDLAAYTDLATLGGFVTRSITLAPRAGGAAPRIVETPSGLAHAVDLQNPGIDQFLALELPWLLQQDARVFVSIVGRSLGEYAELARRLGRMHGLAGVEVNLSPPDAAPSGVFDVREPFHAASVVAAVHRDVPRGLPVVAKLRSDLLRIAETAHVVVEAGAEAVVVGNALPAAMPDGRPAGLSGPAIRPLAMRCLTEVLAATPGATVIACGGIATAADARAALDLGAAAVQVGTALLHDPTAAGRLARELAPTGEDEA